MKDYEKRETTCRKHTLQILNTRKAQPFLNINGKLKTKNQHATKIWKRKKTATSYNKLEINYYVAPDIDVFLHWSYEAKTKDTLKYAQFQSFTGGSGDRGGAFVFFFSISIVFTCKSCDVKIPTPELSRWYALCHAIANEFALIYLLRLFLLHGTIQTEDLKGKEKIKTHVQKDKRKKRDTKEKDKKTRIILYKQS